MKRTTTMRLVPWFMMMICLAVCAPLAPCQTAKAPVDLAARTQQVQALIQNYDQCLKSKNGEGLQRLFDTEFLQEMAKTAGITPQELVKRLFLDERDLIEVKSVVNQVETRDEMTVARLEHLKKWRTKEGKEEQQQQKLVVFLKETNGQLKIANTAQDMIKDEFDPVTRVYQSPKGRYSVQVPASWIPVKGLPGLAGMLPDSAALVGADLKSTVILGFVQLPIKLDDMKQAMIADMTLEKKMTQNHQVLEQGEVSAGGLKGYQLVSEFSSGQTHVKRMRVYLGSHPMLYLFICDAPTSERFAALKGDFNQIIQSFKIVAPPGGQSVKDAVAEQLAQGGISGQTYTSKDYNCFIAAPAGWEIRTSPNPAHLVEMQPAKGKSLVRLIAAKGLRPEDTAKGVCEQRLKQVKGLVKDFKELSRRDVTIQGCPGVESVQTFAVDPLGKFSVKEVTLVRNGIYYLILCQAIEPDQYGALEPNFNAIIQSFGFVQ